MNLTHEYPDRIVELEFFNVTEWSGIPAGLEGQQIRWVNISDLHANELLPADIAVVKELQNL